MDEIVAALIGVDLELSIRTAIAAAPPGDDYVVMRNPNNPRAGTVGAIRTTNVSVASQLNTPINAAPGQLVGQIVVSLTVDIDITLVTPAGVGSQPTAAGLVFTVTVPIAWAGTFPDGSGRNRTSHRIEWAALPIGDVITADEFPEFLTTGHTVPKSVPVATWPDEFSVVTPVQAVLSGGALGPGVSLGTITDPLAAGVVAVVNRVLAAPRRMAGAFGRAGARAVILDFQGSQIYCTAMSWVGADVGQDPLPRARAILQEMDLGWQPGQQWTRPLQLWVSPSLITRSISFLAGADSVRIDAAESVHPQDILPVPGPTGTFVNQEWMEWLARSNAHWPVPQPADESLVAAWRLSLFFGIPEEHRGRAAAIFLREVRRGIWPMEGEVPVDLIEDPDVQINEPSVSLVTRAEMEKAFSRWVNDPEFEREAGAPEGTTHYFRPNFPTPSPFFSDQDVGIKVRMTVHAPYWGVDGHVEIWTLAGIGPFFDSASVAATDLHVRRNVLGDLLQFLVVVGAGVAVGSTIFGLSLIPAVAAPLFAVAGFKLIVLVVEGAEQLLNSDHAAGLTVEEAGIDFAKWLGYSAAAQGALGLGMFAGGLLGPSIGLPLWLVSLWVTDIWLLPPEQARLEDEVQAGLDQAIDEAEDTLAGEFADLAGLGTSGEADPYLLQLASTYCGVSRAATAVRARPFLARATANPTVGILAAVDVTTSVPAVPFRRGGADVFASGPFLISPIEVELGGPGPGYLRIEVENTWSADGTEWLSVRLVPNLPDRAGPVQSFRVPWNVGLSNVDLIELDQGVLEGLRLGLDLDPMETLEFRAGDFDHGAVRWAIWFSDSDRWVVGIATPPSKSRVDRSQLIARAVVRSFEKYRRERVFDGVTADWISGLGRSTLGQFAGFNAGSPEADLAETVNSVLTRFADRFPANSPALGIAIPGLSLVEVLWGRWESQFESVVGGELDFTRDDEVAVNRMRRSIANFLAERARILMVDQSEEDWLESHMAWELTVLPVAVLGAIERLPAGDWPIRPEHFVRAVRHSSPIEVRIIGAVLETAGTAVPRPVPDRLQITTITSFPEGVLRFRIGWRGLLDIGASFTVTVTLAADGTPLGTQNVQSFDLGYTGIAPGGDGVVDEIVTSRSALRFSLPSSLVNTGSAVSTRLNVSVQAPTGQIVTAQLRFTFGSATTEWTDAGERAREAARNHWVFPVDSGSGDDGGDSPGGFSRPDVDDLLGGGDVDLGGIGRRWTLTGRNFALANRLKNWMKVVDPPALPPRPDR